MSEFGKRSDTTSCLLQRCNVAVCSMQSSLASYRMFVQHIPSYMDWLDAICDSLNDGVAFAC